MFTVSGLPQKFQNKINYDFRVSRNNIIITNRGLTIAPHQSTPGHTRRSCKTKGHTDDY